MFHHFSGVEEEDSGYQGRASTYIRRLWPFFRPYLGRAAASAGLLLTATGLGLLGPVLLKRAIDVNIGGGDIAGLAVTSLTYLGLQVAIFFASYFQMVWLTMVGEQGAADLKHRLFSHLLSLPMQFFDKNPVGRLISRVESDTEAIKMLFTRTSVVLVQSLLALVGMSFVMALASWRLYLLVALLLPPFIVAFWLFQRKVRPIYLSVRRTVADINGLIAEALASLPVVQVFGQQARLGEKMDNLCRLKYRDEMKAFTLWYIVWFLVDFGEIIGLVLVLGLGGAWALRGTLTVGTLFMFVAYITRLFGPLRTISDQINVMQRSLASAERVFGLLDTPPEPEREPGKTLTIRDRIAFEKVGLAYDGRNYVLNDIDLVIRRGEKVALVGETGGGKSSIVSLLLKFYTAQQGRILIDGQDLGRIDRHRLRRAVGLVPQEVIMFPGSVLDNLRMMDESIPAEQVIEAAKRTRIHDAIQRFPQGYETNLIERGINLSLGERQLLALARALVFDPQLLVLDEATSSVDPHTEHLIQQALAELLTGRTAIIVAHRLATIRLVDRIVVVHKGRIAEQGSHEELLTKEGLYARFYKLQYLVGEPVARAAG